MSGGHAQVSTDNTNPLKIKKAELDCSWHLVSENLAEMASLFIDRIHPMQGEETRRECTKSEFSLCHSKRSQYRKALRRNCGNRFTRRSPLARFAAMLQANLKKYLPSGYAWGYASGKISKSFQDFQKLSPRQRLKVDPRQRRVSSQMPAASGKRKCQTQLCRFAGNSKDFRMILVSIILDFHTCCPFSPVHNCQSDISNTSISSNDGIPVL
ncbi:hypothetical protein T01_5755 [Trichinella spiralis]|uniref:Uncharacterized protein n=1 Tax=Trichinella spiralis TaxID=6334 RepID=A0A0V1BCS9_TRISP|nr:hypothetical protein T01_5755 [Trichinella spiralis]